MIIRQENKNDFEKIYQFIKTAFETAEVKDGDEQDFVNELRSSKHYIPELAFVAELDGEIIGYIMMTKTYVEHETKKIEVLYLAPLAVSIEYRNKKVGSLLIETALKKAHDMGFKAVFLAGNPAYYNRFGFVASIRHSIKCSLEVPEELYENIMVYELYPQALNGIMGIVKF